MLLQPVLFLQRDQLHPILIHRRNPPRQQRITHARTDHAQQGEDVVDLHRHLRFEPCLLEYPLAVLMGGEALGQGDEGFVADLGQVDFSPLGKLRVGGCGEEDVIGKQRDLFAIRVVDAVVQRHQDRIDFHVLELVEQVDVGAQNQVDVELAAADLQTHDQLRHGLDRQ
ncbi:hypothetical protein D3C81_1621120 [compost metagenome]